MSREARIGVGLCAVLALAACCGAAALTGLGGLLFFQVSRAASPPLTQPMPGVLSPPPTTRPVPSTTPQPPDTDFPVDAPTQTPAAPADDTLTTLQNAALPQRDLRQLAMQLRGIADIPIVVSTQPADHPIGTVLEFDAHNFDTNAVHTVRARLIDKTENAYFFAEDGQPVDAAVVRQLLAAFQEQIYPTDRAFFGSEWTPGVDGDPRLYILYARGLGFGLLGYFYPVDEYSRLAYPASNEKEIFYISADGTSLTGPDLLATLAHEFTHMIQWHHDLNEDTWMSEGSAMLAELINGYQPRGYTLRFARDPDLQLNAWTDGDTIPHYGAAFMFLAYFLDRFGDEATQALMVDPANGLASVDAVLAARGLTDPASGQALTAEEVFADWAVANFVNDPSMADGSYAYHRFQDPPQAATTDTFQSCPITPQSGTVHQFAADYYDIQCPGTYTLTFTGLSQVQVVPTTPADGRYVVWSNRGDEAATSLTRAFDFTGLSAVTLTYRAWWDIEQDYDYAYLEASTDGGQSWTILRAPSTTDTNPVGANFGWGYTGRSDGWVDETVDLSAYAGQQVWLRFEYLTDTALNENGFLVDDIQVPELGYRADFEQDDGGWEAQGFARMDNALPQRFIVQLIRRGAGAPTVERLALDAANYGETTLSLTSGESVTLAVSGVTRFTTEPATYQFSIER